MESARRASWLVEVHLSGVASPVAKAAVLIQTSVCRRVLSTSDSNKLKLFDFHILCWALPHCWFICLLMVWINKDKTGRLYEKKPHGDRTVLQTKFCPADTSYKPVVTWNQINLPVVQMWTIWPVGILGTRSNTDYRWHYVHISRNWDYWISYASFLICETGSVALFLFTVELIWELQCKARTSRVTNASSHAFVSAGSFRRCILINFFLFFNETHNRPWLPQQTLAFCWMKGMMGIRCGEKEQ